MRVVRPPPPSRMGPFWGRAPLSSYNKPPAARLFTQRSQRCSASQWGAPGILSGTKATPYRCGPSEQSGCGVGYVEVEFEGRRWSGRGRCAELPPSACFMPRRIFRAPLRHRACVLRHCVYAQCKGHRRDTPKGCAGRAPTKEEGNGCKATKHSMPGSISFIAYIPCMSSRIAALLIAYICLTVSE